MTQTTPATAVLGPGKTGLAIGVTVLNLDGTTYAAFSATDVAETSVAGTYRKAGGVVCPDAGAYLVWGVSGTPYAEATVDPNATLAATQPAITWGQQKILANVEAEGALHIVNSSGDGIGTKSQGGYSGVTNAGSSYGMRNEGGDGVGLYNEGSTTNVSGVDAQGTRDAMMLAPTAGAPAAGSVDKHLDDILEDTGTMLPGLFAASGATVTVISAVDGGTITLHVGDTWSFTVSDSTLDLSDYETVALVVKRNARQIDNDALLYLRSDTGLARIGGAAPASAGNGTLSKTSTSFTGTVALAETSAAGLIAGRYTWWLKCFDTTADPNEGFTVATGEFVLQGAGLAAVS